MSNRLYGMATLIVMTIAGLAPVSGSAEDGKSLFGLQTASVTYGPYVRFEIGGALKDPDGAYWRPPGAADPRINFNADADDVAFGALAFGFDWQTGIRADVALFGTGTSDMTAPCSSASDKSDCATHADITDASIKTTGVMANVFYAPFEAQGSNSVFQPFLVAGLGVARNEVGDWTREKNPLSGPGRPVRSFEGDTTTGLAWSLGVGASLQVTRPGRWPVIVEAAWRYYDFGTASGGATPLPGNGAEEPRKPFTFENTDQVVTFGVRIPLRRY